jgi:hypothetical protein
MEKNEEGTKTLQKKSQELENKSKKAISEKDLGRLEFHRYGMMPLMPELTDKAPGVVFLWIGMITSLHTGFAHVLPQNVRRANIS